MFLQNATSEENRRYADAKFMRLRFLTAELRARDIEMARIMEDKMRVMGDMLGVLGKSLLPRHLT